MLYFAFCAASSASLRARSAFAVWRDCWWYRTACVEEERGQLWERGWVADAAPACPSRQRRVERKLDSPTRYRSWRWNPFKWSNACLACEKDLGAVSDPCDGSRSQQTSALTSATSSYTTKAVPLVLAALPSLICRTAPYLPNKSYRSSPARVGVSDGSSAGGTAREGQNKAKRNAKDRNTPFVLKLRFLTQRKRPPLSRSMCEVERRGGPGEKEARHGQRRLNSSLLRRGHSHSPMWTSVVTHRESTDCKRVRRVRRRRSSRSSQVRKRASQRALTSQAQSALDSNGQNTYVCHD